tara:strand:- start:4292 stop:4681 length:390 start_codon:yes stop_codon:yes gene_type:complete
LNEHGFIKSVHNKLSKEVYKWKIHDTYTGGVPDAFYAGPAGVLFVEYKYIPKLPSRNNTSLNFKISQLQIQWLQNALDYPLKVALIIGHQSSGYILTRSFDSKVTKEDFITGHYSVSSIAKWIEEQTLP